MNDRYPIASLEGPSYTADIDTGGTFTDGYFTDGERYWLAKVETTPHDLTIGFIACLMEAARQIDLGDVREMLRRCEIIRFSTTLTTNALVQGQGTRLGLITTSGLDDELFDAEASLAPSLLERDLVVTLDQCVDASGEMLGRVNREQVIDRARYLLDRGTRALVVALRDSAQQPAAEREVLRILDAEYPPHLLGRVPVTLSHQVSRRPEDKLRATAALLNARVHALLARALREVEDALRERSARRPLLVVHTDGGCARVPKTRALDTYASGPAAVAYGAAWIGRPGCETAIAMDIGGTTTDLAFLTDGAVRLSPRGRIAGRTVGQPSPETCNLGLGGGSIARLVSSELTLGPDSAGALPGPACFDLGGTAPTVTDACLALGYFDPEHFLGGRRRLSTERALAAIGRLASDAQPRRSALAVKDRFEEEIAHAIRRHAGIDLEGASLLALGGGGGLHAASIAGKLGLREVRAFPFSPVFGAFGSSTLDVVHVYQASLRGRGARANALELGDWFRELVAAAWRDVEDEGFSPSDVEFELVIERISSAPEQVPSLVRLPVTAEQGQILLPAGGTDPEMAWLRARVALTHRTDPHRLVWEPRGERMLGARNVDWGESPVPTDVFRLEGLGGESHLCGPCLVESQFTTLAVPPGWSFLLEPSGWMHLRV